MGVSYVTTYSDPYQAMDSTLMTVLMVYLVIFSIIGIIGLAGYLLKSIGMYRMAQREGMDNPWLSYVPFARTYLQGELSGDIVFQKRSIRNPGIWLILLPMGGGMIIGSLYVLVIIAVAASVMITEGSANGIGIAVVLMLVLLALYIVVLILYQALVVVLKGLVMYQILRKFTSNSMAIVHAFFANLIPMYEAIILFVFRNRPYNPGMEPPGMIPSIMEIGRAHV